MEQRARRLSQALAFARRDSAMRLALMEADPKNPAPFEALGQEGQLGPRERLTLVTELVYEGYLKRMQREIALLEKERALFIPSVLQYEDIPGLSRELQEKLSRKQPKTFLEAMAIPGMTPAALNAIAVHIKKLTSLRPKLCESLGS